jgi:hypothetical protein
MTSVARTTTEQAPKAPNVDAEKGLQNFPANHGNKTEEREYPSGKKVALIMLALMLGMLLVPLVNTSPCLVSKPDTNDRRTVH